MMDLQVKPHKKIKLVEINPHLTCSLCKGYYIDATTISECLHSFCRSCIIKFLHEHSYCPICEVIINKAKPNLKLDKTLQDIVYKLVPELFLNEMRRRQQFYHGHPDLAAKVTPEERGEDTERTIFNPRDTISLSIEYISDDSTPGAILIPQLIDKGVDVNNKNRNQASDNEENSPIKRFLQCPGMCRVEVLKKFIRNKYNVDTNQYYIDILYKRVPLPDHYTLIDIAYIYSWKRNEPLKFYFKITDINLVTDSFDYLLPPQLNQMKQEKHVKTTDKKPARSPIKIETHQKAGKDTDNKKLEKHKPEIKNDVVLKHKDRITTGEIGKTDKNLKNKEYTNITLDRSNNVEIITKIQKVSNKNGLQIGIKITKQTVKKPVGSRPNGVKSAIKDNKELKESLNGPNKPNNPQTPPPLPEIDPEKSNFLKSIELTAKNALHTTSPQKTDLPEKTDLKQKANAQQKPDLTRKTEQPKVNIPVDLPSKQSTPQRQQLPSTLSKKESTPKRKNPSPIKTERPAKKPRKFVNIQPKSIQNPTVMQMVSNVNQNVSSMSKIVDQTTKKPPKSDLQALLFDSYKINIPASLSVTVKNEKDGPSHSAIQKPVQNYIEILKIPENPTSPNSTKATEPKDNSKPNILERLGSSIEVNKMEVKIEDSKTELGENAQSEPLTVDTDGIKQEATDSKQDKVAVLNKPSPTILANLQVSTSKTLKGVPQPKTPTSLPSPAYLPCKVTNMPTRDNFIKLNPRTPQTFQKMFEEAIKKPEFNSKFQTVPPATKSETTPTSITKTSTNATVGLPGNDTPSTGKRNILEIASKLYKKTKMEQEKVINGVDPPKSPTKPLNVPRPNQHKSRKPQERGNPPLKDFNSYISSKNQPQTVTSLHSPSLGLNYTVSVSQTTANPTVLSKTPLNAELSKQASSKLEIDLRCSTSPKLSPRQSAISPRLPQQTEPTTLNIPRKYSASPKPSALSPQHHPRQVASKEVSSTSPVPNPSSSVPKLSPGKKPQSPTRKLTSPTGSKVNLNVVTSTHSENNQPLSPNQILEKYNIQNLAQLTANFNFPPNLCMNSAANQLAAIHQAMIYRHFEMQNHQNWLNMNPGPLMQYEKYLQSLSKS